MGILIQDNGGGVWNLVVNDSGGTFSITSVGGPIPPPIFLNDAVTPSQSWELLVDVALQDVIAVPVSYNSGYPSEILTTTQPSSFYAAISISATVLGIQIGIPVNVYFSSSIFGSSSVTANVFAIFIRQLNAQIVATIGQANTLIQSLVSTATSAYAVAAVQSDMNAINAAAPQLIGNEPLVVSVSTYKSILLMKSITVVRRAMMIPVAGAPALGIQLGALYIALRKLEQLNFLGTAENQGPIPS